MRMRPIFGITATVVALAACAPSVAHASDMTTCIGASELAQSLRDEGKYTKTREQLLICARDVCPSAVRVDCLQWLSEVDASMPSVVLSAKGGDGRDLVDVSVSLDGVALATRLDGRPVPIDPGEHEFRFQASGMPPGVERLVIRAGEKNRRVAVNLGAAPSPSPPPTQDRPPIAAREIRGGGAPVGGYVLGGVGVLALGSFAFFGLTGRSDVTEMENTCAPNCDSSKVDAARTKLLVANVSLGVGAVALGVATYLILTHKSPAPATTTAGAIQWDVATTSRGGLVTMGARF